MNKQELITAIELGEIEINDYLDEASIFINEYFKIQLGFRSYKVREDASFSHAFGVQTAIEEYVEVTIHHIEAKPIDEGDVIPSEVINLIAAKDTQLEVALYGKLQKEMEYEHGLK